MLAKVNYLRVTSGRPAYFTESRERMDATCLDTRSVSMIDCRGRLGEAKLSSSGFELIDHRSRVTDFSSDDQLNTIYVPETIELMKVITGASNIHLTPPVRRWSERESHPQEINSRPGRIVHVDYDRRSFYDCARYQVSEDSEKQRWLGGRFAAFNIWRVVTPPPQDCPLAFIDRRTTNSADIVEGDVIVCYDKGVEGRFGTSFYTWNPGHKWCYFSGMVRDEVLVFLAYDSADDTLPGTPHSAFDDPTCPAASHARASCELRAYVYWG